MAIGRSRSTARRPAASDKVDASFTFPVVCRMETMEQMRRFELLRLAFFVLKLRKLEGQVMEETSLTSRGREEEREFRRNLLHHVIFQQVLTLTRLDAREQAMQIIAACRQ